MKDNQKILYDNFKKEAETHLSPVIRERCKNAAEEILKSYPDFEVKEKVVEKKTIKDKEKK